MSTFAALLALGGLELAARGYLWLRPAVGHVERWEFRRTRPPAYQAADYCSPAFLIESMTCQRDFVNPPHTHFWVPGDYAGTAIHVSTGQRRTDFQPTAGNRVLLFGGSTVFCAEVPDAETIASRLQLLINNSGGPPLVVENFGVPAMSALQQLGRLQTVRLRPHDVVIFFDGVNDVYYPVFNANPRGWLPGDSHDGGVRKLNAAQRATHQAFIRFGDRSGLVRLLYNIENRTLPRVIADENTLRKNVGQAESGYRTALAGARDYARKAGAEFVHFVQPNIFTLKVPSPHERWLIENELKNLPGLDRAFQATYPRLRQAAAEICGEANFDLSELFDRREPAGEIFLDFCHANHVANQMLARKIFELAFPSRDKQGSRERMAASELNPVH